MKRDLQHDMMRSEWFMEKIQNDSYAQNIYAAICNNRFFPNEIWPLLRESEEDQWTASWRSAGGIVANLQGRGSYMDWYCSGSWNAGYEEGEDERHMQHNGYVPESVVTDEVRSDLIRLGWVVRPYDD